MAISTACIIGASRATRASSFGSSTGSGRWSRPRAYTELATSAKSNSSGALSAAAAQRAEIIELSVDHAYAAASREVLTERDGMYCAEAATSARSSAVTGSFARGSAWIAKALLRIILLSLKYAAAASSGFRMLRFCSYTSSNSPTVFMFENFGIASASFRAFACCRTASSAARTRLFSFRSAVVPMAGICGKIASRRTCVRRTARDMAARALKTPTTVRARPARVAVNRFLHGRTLILPSRRPKSRAARSVADRPTVFSGRAAGIFIGM